MKLSSPSSPWWPHNQSKSVVALLFRSLISEPDEIVSSSASALHNALVLCAPSKGSTAEEGSSKGHRLPKELIQSCIRPILLHLRECTELDNSSSVERSVALVESPFVVV